MIAETICEQQDTIKQLQDIINKLRETVSELRETVSEYKKQNELLQQEVDTLSNRLEIEEEDSDDEISPVVDNEDDAEWLPLKGYEEDYVIWDCYPYPIKNDCRNHL